MTQASLKTEGILFSWQCNSVSRWGEVCFLKHIIFKYTFAANTRYDNYNNHDKPGETCHCVYSKDVSLWMLFIICSVNPTKYTCSELEGHRVIPHYILPIIVSRCVTWYNLWPAWEKTRIFQVYVVFSFCCGFCCYFNFVWL